MVRDFTYIIIFFICKICGMRNAIGAQRARWHFLLLDFIVDADRASDKEHSKANGI